MSTAHLIGREELMAFLDGELAPPRAAIVRGHVEGCGECATAADDWRALSSSLREWHVEAAPATLVAPRTLTALKPLGPARPSRWVPFTRQLGRLSPWLAAAATVLVVSYFVVPRPALAPSSPAVVDELYSIATTTGAAATEGMPALKRDETRQSVQPTLDKEAFDAKAAARSLPPPAPSMPAPPVPLPPMAAKKALEDARMIVRTATLGLSTDRFDDVLKRMQAVAERHGGTVSAYQVAGNASEGRSLSATVRVPVAAVDEAIGELRSLGTVTGESQGTEEITDAHRDLAIRIDNAKREAARLNELLTRQSDRLSDVLQVEQAQARVQTEIEQMTAEETAMRGRAAMSAIMISVAEVRHAELALGPLPIGTRVRNAMVDGLRAASESALGAVLALISLAPSALLWLFVVLPLAFLAWWGTRLLRRRMTP